MWECGMLSAQEMATAKVAVEICNNPKLKKKILYTPDDMNDDCWYDRKRKWEETLEREARGILKTFGLLEVLHDKILVTVELVGMRMHTWAEYHEAILGCSREYSSHFLNASFFTQRGIINSKRAAEEMVKDINLSIEQKYKLACIHCFTDQIPDLYGKLTEEKKEWFRKRMQPGLVRFWSCYHSGEVDRIKGDKTLDQYRLEKVVESGSIAAVQYCLEKTNLRRQGDAIVDVGLETVRNRIIASDDYNVFRDQMYLENKESWVPRDYYVDVLCFLLSKMREDQQMEFLKRDIEGPKYNIEVYEISMHSRVLEYLLDWPYQGYFMKTAGIMWEFLPESSYAVLLLKICDKIEPKKGYFTYSEEKTYDYKELLNEFWRQSPERYKRYVFSNHKVYYDIVNWMYKVETGVGLLMKVLTLQKFTCEDARNIEQILASATDIEKENITSSKEWRNLCIQLLKEEKLGLLDWIAVICFPHKEELDKFKREFIFTKEAVSVCVNFVKNDKWNEAESAIKWSALPEKEVNKLKKEMIYSVEGIQACLSFVRSNKLVEDVNRYIWWHLSSEEVKTFKKDLIFSEIGAYKCAILVTDDKLDLLRDFINLCLSSKEDIRILNRNVAYKIGSLVLKELISDSSEEEVYNEEGWSIGCTTNFKGGKWEDVEKFLTWCFSSEREISEFKKNMLLKESGAAIHFNLIKSSQWEEAETFFAWLELSADEIKDLKKETLFDYDKASSMFREQMHRDGMEAEYFIDYGSKEEAAELLLRWYLTDKETILEFKDEFERQCSGEVTEEREAMIENFDRAITQRLRDLEEEERT